MGKTVLVVDDSSAIRQSIKFVLEQNGYSVVEAGDGKDGLEKLEAKDIHLIISDVNMPNMDGIEFTRQVRANGLYKFTPIIILTTESQGSKMEEGKAAGATGWIVKPFDSDKLMGVINKIMG